MNDAKQIECKFIPIKNSRYGVDEKEGRYSQSMYWEVPGFGQTKWVVLGYLDIDWVKEMEVSGKTEDTIIDGCISFLNSIPGKKKQKKSDIAPLYGQLERFKADFKVKDGKPFIIGQFITDEQANEHFWNEGLSSSKSISPKKKRGENNKETEKEDGNE